jgi:hypothetical protein
MNNWFEKHIDELVEKLEPYSSDEKLAELYQWSEADQKKQLSQLKGNSRSLIDKIESGKTQLDRAFLLRQYIKDIDFDFELSKWVIEVWGGITGSNDDSLEKCLLEAKNGNFDFNRIASWSKDVAFQHPDEYAIYDARVIYSLNWLLYQVYQVGEEKYFPAPAGRNSVMELLDYRVLLFIKHYSASVVRNELEEDISKRKQNPGRKSFVANKLRGKLFIEPNDAFKAYCDLLKILAEKIYPDDSTGLRLTKIEMLLFSLADKDIALNVFDAFSGENMRYEIDDLMILDAENNPVQKIYIRELLDSSCSEYQRSKLGRQQKIDIINALGLEVLIKVLAECFRRKGAKESAAEVAKFTWQMLTGKYDFGALDGEK